MHVSKSQYFFSNLNSNCSNLLDMRNLQEQVKKAFCYQKLSWPFTVWINCSSDLKKFANSRPSASNFQSFSWSLEQFFLTVGQNNFGNKKYQSMIISSLHTSDFLYANLPESRCDGNVDILIPNLSTNCNL